MQSLLRHKEIRDEIEERHLSSAGVLHNFCDGEFVKNHPLLKEHPEALSLAFYFDDLETANPLGSRRGKHKLGMPFKVHSIHMYFESCILIHEPQLYACDYASAYI